MNKDNFDKTYNRFQNHAINKENKIQQLREE